MCIWTMFNGVCASLKENQAFVEVWAKNLENLRAFGLPIEPWIITYRQHYIINYRNQPEKLIKSVRKKRLMKIEKRRKFA